MGNLNIHVSFSEKTKTQALAIKSTIEQKLADVQDVRVSYQWNEAI